MAPFPHIRHGAELRGRFLLLSFHRRSLRSITRLLAFDVALRNLPEARSRNFLRWINCRCFRTSTIAKSERRSAMKMPRDRNDRVLLVAVSALVGLGLAVGLSNVTVNAPATAEPGAARPEVFRAQPPRGPVPYAHTVARHAKSDGAASIVRDPKDLPPPIGKRGPRRVKVDLETARSSASSPTAPPIATGPSTIRCRVHSSACASATRSRCGSRTTKTAC